MLDSVKEIITAIVQLSPADRAKVSHHLGRSFGVSSVALRDYDAIAQRILSNPCKEFPLIVQGFLGDEFDKSGKVLFSGPNSLKKGDIYLLGLNVGGNPDDLELGSIRQSIFPHACDNAYVGESWADRPEGTHHIQLRVRWLVKSLGYKVNDTCASNLSFFRSRNAESASYPVNADKCWPVHEAVLRVVDPGMVITIGNGGISSFRYLVDRKTSDDRRGPQLPDCPSGHGNWRCEAATVTLAGRPRVVAGLPHLSRYDIIGKQKVIHWLRGLLSEAKD